VACAASGALQHQAARRKITIALVLIHTPGEVGSGIIKQDSMAA
jgi:hypothetical protein